MKTTIALIIVLVSFASAQTTQVNHGGTGLDHTANNDILIGTGPNTYLLTTLPDCQDTSGNHWNYNATTHSVTCGTSSSSGSGISGATSNGAMYATGTTTGTSTVALTDGKILIGDSSGAPQANTITAGSGVSIVNGHHTITINATAPGTCNGSSSTVSAFDAQEQASSVGSTGTQATFAQAVTCGDWMFFAQHSEDGTTDPPVVTDASGACGNASHHFTLLGKNSASSNKLWLYACKATTSVSAGDTVSSTVTCSDCGSAIWQMSGLRGFDTSTNTYTSGSTPSLAITPSQTSEVIISAMAMFHNVAVSTPTSPLTQIISQGGFDAMNTAWEQITGVSTVTTAWTCCGAFSGTDNIPMVDAAFFVGTSPSSQTVYNQSVQADGTAQTQEVNLDFVSGTGITMSGADDSANNRTKITANIANTGVTAGSCGDATHSCSLTINAQGQITAQSNNSIPNTGSGQYTKLCSGTISSSTAALKFDASNNCSGADPFSSTYAYYDILCDHFTTTNSTNTQLAFRVATTSGSYDSGSNYGYSTSQQTNTNFTNVFGGNTGQNLIAFTSNSTSSTGDLASAEIIVLNPSSTTTHKAFFTRGLMLASDSNWYVNTGSGRYISNSAILDIEFLWTAGNVSTGTCTIWGLP